MRSIQQGPTAQIGHQIGEVERLAIHPDHGVLASYAGVDKLVSKPNRRARIIDRFGVALEIGRQRPEFTRDAVLPDECMKHVAGCPACAYYLSYTIDRICCSTVTEGRDRGQRSIIPDESIREAGVSCV